MANDRYSEAIARRTRVKKVFKRREAQLAEDRRRRGRTPIDRYWIARILELFAQEPKKTIHEIFETLKGEGEELRRNDYPSERTIPALKRRFYDPLTPEEKGEYTWARWPESFSDTGPLPWEAAPAVLELIADCEWRGIGRPTVRHARWFYRLRLARPDLPKDKMAGHTHRLAAMLAGWEVGGHLPTTNERRLDVRLATATSWAEVGFDIPADMGLGPLRELVLGVAGETRAGELMEEQEKKAQDGE